MSTPVTSPDVHPFAHLSAGQLDELAREFDAIHDQVRGDLGERDRRYIKGVIKLHRQIAVVGRALLLGSRSKPAWLAGTGCLAVAKILENMEIGHNVLHGQWDWMNDPYIHSSTWDWDTASTAAAWKHSHNFVHHTYTNIRGKDKDLGYEIMRIDPHQKWHPAYLAQPLYNLLLMAFFEWGVAVHDLDVEAIRSGEKPMKDVWHDIKGISGKARDQILKDYVGWPLVSALAATAVGRLARPEPRSRLRVLADRAGGRAPEGRGARPAGSDPHGRRRHVRRDVLGELHGQHHPQPVGALDHLLRPLPGPDLHVRPGRGPRRDPRRLVRPAARRRGEHHRLPAVPPDEREPRVPGRAPPVPGHAEQPLRRDRPAGPRDLLYATACRTTPGRSPASSARSTARSCGWPSRAASPARSRGRTRATRWSAPLSPERTAWDEVDRGRGFLVVAVGPSSGGGDRHPEPWRSSPQQPPSGNTRFRPIWPDQGMRR